MSKHNKWKFAMAFQYSFFIEALLNTTTMHEIAKWINERIESRIVSCRVVSVALETSFHRKYCTLLITIIIEINDNDFAKKKLIIISER